MAQARPLLPAIASSLFAICEASAKLPQITILLALPIRKTFPQLGQ